jgi:hypothetical protein
MASVLSSVFVSETAQIYSKHQFNCIGSPTFAQNPTIYNTDLETLIIGHPSLCRVMINFIYHDGQPFSATIMLNVDTGYDKYKKSSYWNMVLEKTMLVEIS